MSGIRELTPREEEYVSRRSLSDIADILERTAEIMWVDRHMDNGNVLMYEVVVIMYDEGHKSALDADVATRLFIQGHSPFWRARFYRIDDKVHAYLMMAAEARQQHEEKTCSEN